MDISYVYGVIFIKEPGVLPFKDMNEFPEGKKENKEGPHYNQSCEFFRNFIKGIEPGRILLPAEGTGGNALFAAGLGWEVDAFDFSLDTRKKAIDLARKEGAGEGYFAGNIEFHELEENMYDVIALLFVDIKRHNRSFIHKKLITSLKNGGFFLVETIIQNREDGNHGGNIDPRYDIDDLMNDFSSLEIETLHEEIPSRDGDHSLPGQAGMLRLVAIKP
jgi:SAM-dependent methyltransferase